MKSSVIEQFATVHEDSASLFDARLNEKVRELHAFSPKVKFSESIPFYAHISYTLTEAIPETVAEASELNGASFVCAQCPYFMPAEKDNGEPDKRCKWGNCEHAEFGRTYKTSKACDKLYELIKEGDVKLCFKD